MSKFTRKRGLPSALVLALGIIGALAVFVAVAVQPDVTHAQADPCEGPFAPLLPQCQDGGTATPTPTTPPPGTTPTPIDPMAGDVKIESSSTSGSATVELKLTVKLKEDVPVGGAIVLYLEDDYQEPDSISASDVYFVVDPGSNNTALKTGNGARVYATQSPEIDTDDHFTADKDDIDIRVSVPDLCTTDTPDCQDLNGLKSGDTVTLVFQKSAGIKNPSEEGTHSVGASVLGPTDNVGGPMYTDAMIDNAPLRTWAKIGISDVDNSRGYEMTVTGSGFNNGTTAAVYVLATKNLGFKTAQWWETLDCAGMKAAMKAAGVDADDTYCFHYNINASDYTYTLGMGSAAFNALSDADKMARSASVQNYGRCATIVEFGTEVGGTLVGSDDKAAVTFEVTAPTFQPGNVNYMCMVDGEGRASHRDVEDFNLQPSIKVVPSSVASGDTVNVFAQDFPHGANMGFVEVKIAGQVIPDVTGSSIRMDGSGEATFDVPGGLEGVLRIDAKWGSVNEDSKITITGGDLSVSKTDALPNETITVTGNGFGSQTCIPTANITLDNVPVIVDEESISSSGGCSGSSGVEVSNSGQFVATIILWPASSGSNPTLIPGVHELSVEDTKGFGSDVDITIPEPTVTVTPDVAGPRDYITIMGENWPVDNPENPSSVSISVEVDDNPGANRARTYILFADAVGRVTQEHRVHRGVAIPSTVQIKMTHAEVAEIGSFSIPASTIEVTPGEAQPGDMISLTAGNMPVYSEVDYVEVGGTRSNDPGVNTDRDGNVTVEDVLIPGLDPGTYSVVINVKGTIAIGEVDVLAESSAAGAPAELPGAVENLGDNLVAIFHFDDVGKTWSFYDPRPEFADLNTLTEMVNGEAYWILVSESVADVVLNNKVRSLTCRGDDCWNLEVW